MDGSWDGFSEGNTLGANDGSLLGAKLGNVEGNALGADDGTLLGADDGHEPHVALHAWKTPSMEHFFLPMFAQDPLFPST